MNGLEGVGERTDPRWLDGALWALVLFPTMLLTPQCQSWALLSQHPSPTDQSPLRITGFEGGAKLGSRMWGKTLPEMCSRASLSILCPSAPAHLELHPILSGPPGNFIQILITSPSVFCRDCEGWASPPWLGKNDKGTFLHSKAPSAETGWWPWVPRGSSRLAPLGTVHDGTGTWPGLAGVTGVSKEGSYREDTNPNIPFCVSDSSAPRGLQSHDWIIWLVLNARRFLRMMSRHQGTSLMLWFLTWRGCFESLSGSLSDKHGLSHLSPASLSSPSSEACPGNSELFVVPCTLGQESRNFICKGPNSKYFRLCRPYRLCTLYILLIWESESVSCSVVSDSSQPHGL